MKKTPAALQWHIGSRLEANVLRRETMTMLPVFAYGCYNDEIQHLIVALRITLRQDRYHARQAEHLCPCGH
jgi:hypothetical protein